LATLPSALLVTRSWCLLLPEMQEGPSHPFQVLGRSSFFLCYCVLVLCPPSLGALGLSKIAVSGCCRSLLSPLFIRRLFFSVGDKQWRSSPPLPGPSALRGEVLAFRQSPTSSLRLRYTETRRWILRYSRRLHAVSFDFFFEVRCFFGRVSNSELLIRDRVGKWETVPFICHGPFWPEVWSSSRSRGI